MPLRRICLAIVLAVCGLAAAAQAQDGPGRGRGPGGPGGPFGPDGPGGPPGRGWDRGPGGPQNREDFRNQMFARFMDRLSELYELQPDQREQVEKRMEELRQEHRQAIEPQIREAEAMREQWREARERGEEPDPEQEREMRERMRTLFRRSPMMDRERVADELGKLLPAEQAEQGRQRFEEEAAEWERRREEGRQRWEAERARREAAGESWPPPPPEDDPRFGDRERPEDGGRNRFGGRDRGRGRNRDRTEGTDEEITAQAIEEPEGDESQDRFRDEGRNRWDRRRRGEDEGEMLRAEPNPLGSWERYVRDFIRRYELDDSQQASALSVLRDLLAERRAFEQTRREELQAARHIEDADVRRRQVDATTQEIDREVTRLFAELRSRLDRIPTSAQKQRVERQSPVSTTRPARTAETQPAGAATSQPAADATAQPAERQRDPDRERQRDPGRERGRRTREADSR